MARLPRVRLPAKVVRLAMRIFDIEPPDIDQLNGRNIEYSFVICKLASAPKGKVLDVGCCSANNIVPVALTGLGFEVWGLDIRQFRLDHPDYHSVIGDIRHTDFPNGFFDCVTAISTIEHIGLTRYGEASEDLDGDKNALREIARILKPTGRFLLTVPFGIQVVVKPLHRIYDNQGLTELWQGYRVLEGLYYARDGAGYWRKVSPELAEETRRQGRESLALLELSPIK